MAKQKNKKVLISVAANGFIFHGHNEYGQTGDPEIFSTFEDVVHRVAVEFDQEAFAQTIHESQAMAQAMTKLCGAAVAPRLLAIETKMNPGIENVVKAVDDPDF
jgi:hypothetical protein